jgi:hypothetical protein
MSDLFKQHIHYDVSDLSLEEKKDLMKLAFGLAFEWWVDELNCSKSFCRKKVDMSFDDILDKLKENAHVVFINRKERPDTPEHLEVGFCSMGVPVEYFLWIRVPISEKDVFKEYMKKVKGA